MRTHSHSFTVISTLTGTVKLRRSSIHSQHRLFGEVAFNLAAFGGALYSPLKNSSSAPGLSRHCGRRSALGDGFAEPNIKLAVIAGDGFDGFGIDTAIEIDMLDAPVVHRLLTPGGADDTGRLAEGGFLWIDAVLAEAPFCAAQTI